MKGILSIFVAILLFIIGYINPAILIYAQVPYFMLFYLKKFDDAKRARQFGDDGRNYWEEEFGDRESLSWA